MNDQLVESSPPGLKIPWATSQNIDSVVFPGNVQAYQSPSDPSQSYSRPSKHVVRYSNAEFTRPTVNSEASRLQAGAIRNVGDYKAVSPTRSQDPRDSRRSQVKHPLLSLSHQAYGLCPQLVDNFAAHGIQTIYPWQSSCLLGRGVLGGTQNLVYTAPTGGGKSLVADVLMLKRVMENPGMKAILVLPYVALVQEKLAWIKSIVRGVSKDVHGDTQHSSVSRHRVSNGAECAEVRVAGFHGSSRAKELWPDFDIAVCTIEKANALINTAIDDRSIDQLGCIVFDELHMIDDDGRGYLMELSASKILALGQKTQIIGMSATLSNTELLAKWLGAKFYRSDYRPVPVNDFLVHQSGIFPANVFIGLSEDAKSAKTLPRDLRLREIDASDNVALKNDSVNSAVSLTIETVKQGYGVLVFCGSRFGCEHHASLISDVMPDEVVPIDILQARKDVLTALRNTEVGLEGPLEHTIPLGVAYHHAGMTTEEREIIASAYDRGVVKVIVATCSLAAGINLPARRVVLLGAKMGLNLITPTMLRQMRGRAGRKGKDVAGESYLCCPASDLQEILDLLRRELPNVESCLLSEKKFRIRRAILEVIATRLATSVDALEDYMSCTLLKYTHAGINVATALHETLSFLQDAGLITPTVPDFYEPTRLGQAIVFSSLTIEDGVFLHDEISRALRAFVMDGEMHIFYMFTPLASVEEEGGGRDKVDWKIFSNEMDNLDDSGVRVLTSVGINPGRVTKLAQGATLKTNTAEEITISRVYRRFYSAFQLRDLCNEMPITAVARKYAVPRGTVQLLAQNSAGFAAGCIKFCERMGWGMLGAVLEHMRDRLTAGARPELLDLARVPFVKSHTARIFWENGLRDVRSVAGAEVSDLVPVLYKAQPRKLRLSQGDEQAHTHALSERAEAIISAANRIWSSELHLTIDE